MLEKSKPTPENQISKPSLEDVCDEAYNEILRKHLPKGVKLENLSSEEIEAMVAEHESEILSDMVGFAATLPQNAKFLKNLKSDTFN